MRSDHGTENTTLAACHMALRHEHNDEFSGEKSFRFGASTTNTVELNLRFVCAKYGCWEHKFVYIVMPIYHWVYHCHKYTHKQFTCSLIHSSLKRYFMGFCCCPIDNVQEIWLTKMDFGWPNPVANCCF